jgi:hypothetical protein
MSDLALSMIVDFADNILHNALKLIITDYQVVKNQVVKFEYQEYEHDDFLQIDTFK